MSRPDADHPIIAAERQMPSSWALQHYSEYGTALAAAECAGSRHLAGDSVQGSAAGSEHLAGTGNSAC